MTTQQTNTMAMTDHELEQVNAGAFPLIPFLVLEGVSARPTPDWHRWRFRGFR